MRAPSSRRGGACAAPGGSFGRGACAVRGGLGVGLCLLTLCAFAFAQGPVPVTRGTYMSGEGKATPIEWKLTNAKATETADALRLEVEPKVRGTADSAPLSLLPLRVYNISMTCRRGPGVGLDIRVNWLNADKQPGFRQMVWQLPDRWRINWWPISALKNTYAQRFILPPGATQVTLQIAMTGHPDAGFNYFDLYDLTLSRGAEVPFGANLGPNLLLSGDMETATAEGMALGWGYWSADPGAKLVEKDPQGRPAHGGKYFLAFPAEKNCILADGSLPIEPGRAYRLSFWARGKGDIGIGAQTLEESKGERIGDAQQVPYRVESDDWQQFSYIWFSDALHVYAANIFMGINTRAELDLDDVTFQLVTP